MMSVRKLAILGAAHGHVSYVTDGLAGRSDVELVALVDHDEARRRGFSEKLGVPGYADLDALHAQHAIDGAAVVAEPGLRAGLIEACLEKGIFVIADKPLALTVDEVDRIAKVDNGSNRVALMLEKRFYPVTRKARELFLNGEIGDLVAVTATGPHKLLPSARPAWFFDPSLYGTIVNDLAIHDIDLVLWLTASSSGRISGWKSPRHPEGHSTFSLAGRALLTLDTGVQAAIDMDWRQPEAAIRHGDYAMRLVGTRGRMDILFGEGRLLVQTDDRRLWEPDLPPPIGPAQDALDALTGVASLQVSTKEALLASRLAALAALSAENGGQDYLW